MMAVLAKIVFASYVLVIAAGAFTAALAKSLVRALLGLILTLFGVAGLYLLMNAPLMAFMQLLIYVGAVSILIFFALMLVRSGPGGEEEGVGGGLRKTVLSLLVLAAPAVILGTVILRAGGSGGATPADVPVAELGKGLLGPYVLAFELISLVLFVAMAGAVLVAFERRDRK